MAAVASLIATGFPLEHSGGILKKAARIPGQLRSPIVYGFADKPQLNRIRNSNRERYQPSSIPTLIV